MYRGQICNLDITRTNQSYPPQISRFERNLPFFWVCSVLGVKYHSNIHQAHPNTQTNMEPTKRIKSFSSIFVFCWVYIYLACGSYACRILDSKGAVQNRGIPNLFLWLSICCSLKSLTKSSTVPSYPQSPLRTLLSCKITLPSPVMEKRAHDFTEIGVK